MGHAVVQEVAAGRRVALTDPSGVDELYVRRLLQERTPVFHGRWVELKPYARHALLRMKQPGQPPTYSSMTKAEQEALQTAGVCSEFGDWLEDPPFYDWIWRRRDSLRDEQ